MKNVNECLVFYCRFIFLNRVSRQIKWSQIVDLKMCSHQYLTTLTYKHMNITYHTFKPYNFDTYICVEKLKSLLGDSVVCICVCVILTERCQILFRCQYWNRKVIKTTASICIRILGKIKSNYSTCEFINSRKINKSEFMCWL